MKRGLGAEEWLRRGFGGCRADRCGGYRAGLGYALPVAIQLFEHCRDRAEADRAAGQAGGCPAIRHANGSQSAADAVFCRRDTVVQLAAASRRIAARQSGAGGFLDLFMHQLPAHVALSESMGSEVSRPGAGDRWRAYAGVRVREGPAQCRAGDQRSGHQISGGDG